MTATTSTPTNIAVVTCSTRSPRLNPYITNYVLKVLAPEHPQVTFTVIDLEAQGLPFYDEPGIPALLPKDNPSPHYVHDHTRRWSAKISQHDAFIFVTPQYNWSIPASLKNALDFLYHEWAGKPALVVSYGGKGGSKAAAHLQQILGSMHMKVTRQTPMFVVTTDTLKGVVDNGKADATDDERWCAANVDGQLKQSFLAMADGSDVLGRM
ncbi:hypothetical protein VHEMI10284 [[Torrubiella] hemipterigena]|uniref:NADPH-dependent FMN reductase-like domain-containing protein n=1 Tax=[Torrubiella] hemipterigena TaxID=1531966 RepID=A0A0A1TT24_9HYPO|nr:hypothetical protein VHEMI10284 [[Torrubiella] hemipterigena]